MEGIIKMRDSKNKKLNSSKGTKEPKIAFSVNDEVSNIRGVTQSFSQIFSEGKQIFKRGTGSVSERKLFKQFRKKYLWILILLGVFCAFLWVVSTILI